MFPLKTLIVGFIEEDLEALLRNIKLNEDALDIDVLSVVRNFNDAFLLLKETRFDLSIILKQLGDGKDCYDLIKLFDQEKFGVIVLDAELENDYHILPLGTINKLHNHLHIPKPYSDLQIKKLAVEVQNIRAVETKPQAPKKHKIYAKDGWDVVLNEEKIYFVQARGNHSKYHYMKPDNEYVPIDSPTSLKEVEEILDKTNFFRCQKSYIVNISCITKIKTDKKGGGVLSFSHGSETNPSMIPVAKYSIDFSKALHRKLTLQP